MFLCYNTHTILKSDSIQSFFHYKWIKIKINRNEFLNFLETLQIFGISYNNSHKRISEL